MNALTYIFPAAVLAFCLLALSDYLPLLRSKPLEIPAASRRWSRFDSLALGLLTAVYAVTAFTGLGNTHGVQSWCRFDERGQYALVELEQETELTALRYFTGLHTGNYYVQVSRDGETFTDVGVLEQHYADLFKWKTVEYDQDETRRVKYIRLIADSELWLGELAVYASDGRLLGPGELRWPAGCDALFDEQQEIPAEYDYANSSYFDEIYHARTALEHLENVYPYEISHPPLGKLILGAGIALFGMTPFGWRFSGTLIGVLMLPALYFFLKKLFGGKAVPICLTTVFAFDFMHYVQTRIATIDSYAVFFIILMYLSFWLFLRAARERLRDWLPPLALSGVFFGLGAASKWICFYAGAGLAVLWLLDRIWRFQALRRSGEGEELPLETKGEGFLRETLETVLWSVLFFLVVPAVIYYLSYWPYGTASGLQAPWMLFSGEYLDIVLDNQRYMFSYHSGVSSSHPYSSVWWQWVLDIRPILYYLQYPAPNTHVSFGAWVSPLLCWGGLLAMLCVLWQVIRRRDKTAVFILVGYLAQLVPWMFVSRPVFEYHYFPSTVFLLLALGYVFRQMELARPRRLGWLIGFAALSVGLFILFYPALRGLPVSGAFGQHFLKWLPSWPF